MAPPSVPVDEIEEGLDKVFPGGLSLPEAIASLLVAVLDLDRAARRLQERPNWRRQLEMRIKDLTSPRTFSAAELARLRAEWPGVGARARHIESLLQPRQHSRLKDRAFRDVWFVRYLCCTRAALASASQSKQPGPGRPAGLIAGAIAEWAAKTGSWARGGGKWGRSRLERAAHLEWRLWSRKRELLKRAYVHRRLRFWLGAQIEDRPRGSLPVTDEATGKVRGEKIDKDELYRKMWSLIESKVPAVGPPLTFEGYRREWLAQSTSTSVDVNISSGRIIAPKEVRALGVRVSPLRPGRRP